MAIELATLSNRQPAIVRKQLGLIQQQATVTALAMTQVHGLTQYGALLDMQSYQFRQAVSNGDPVLGARLAQWEDVQHVANVVLVDHFLLGR